LDGTIAKNDIGEDAVGGYQIIDSTITTDDIKDGTILDEDIKLEPSQGNKIDGDKVKYATTDATGTVRLATSADSVAGLVVQSNDTRLIASVNAFVSTAPATSNRNIIQPSADFVVPLRVKGFASGSADVLEIYDSASSPVLAWKFDKDGNLDKVKAGVTVDGINVSDAFIKSPSATQEVAYQVAAVQTVLKMAASPTKEPLVLTDSDGNTKFWVSRAGGIYTKGVSSFTETINIKEGKQIRWNGDNESNTNLYRAEEGRIKTDGDLEATKVYAQTYYKGNRTFDDVYVTTGTGVLGSPQEISGVKKITALPGTSNLQPSFEIYPSITGDVLATHNLFRVGIDASGSGSGERFRISASSVVISKAGLLINSSYANGGKLSFNDGMSGTVELYYDSSNSRLKAVADFEATKIYGTQYYKNNVAFDTVYITTSTDQEISGRKIITTIPGTGSLSSFMVYPGYETSVPGDVNPLYNLFKVGISVAENGSGERFKVSASSVVISKAGLLINSSYANGGKLSFTDGDGGTSELYFDSSSDRLTTGSNFNAAGYFKNGVSFDTVYITTSTDQEISGRKTIVDAPSLGPTFSNAAFVIKTPVAITPNNSNLFGVGTDDGKARFRVATSSVIITNSYLQLPANSGTSDRGGINFGAETNTNLYRDNDNNKLVTDGSLQVKGNENEFGVIVSSVVTTQDVALKGNKKIIFDTDGMTYGDTVANNTYITYNKSVSTACASFFFDGGESASMDNTIDIEPEPEE
ncbi:MAG: hypothetical protein V1833_06675, partial [Elusimicrobiota bacterium]